MTPEEIAEMAIKQAKNSWNRIDETVRLNKLSKRELFIELCDSKKRIAELEKEFLFWKLEATAKGKTISELEAEVERLKGDNKHLNDLLNSALKEKETAEIENERLVKNNS